MLLLKNGKILDNNGELISTDILIEAGNITNMAPHISASSIKEVVDLKGKFIAPGLIDVHVHLREPGGEHKETIATGTKAAARGGYTLVAAMPNTNPVPDDRPHLDALLAKIESDAIIRVLPYGSITQNLKGETLVNFEALAHDVIGFTDDGKGIQTAGQMYEAMVQAAAAGKPIVAHCEDESVLFGGYFHAGDYAKTHGHKGILSATESIHIARDALLAKATGVHYHVCHVSTKESVSLIRWAKAEGIHITAEVSPHHLLLSDKHIPASSPENHKMNPPLRGEDDRLACLEGLLDGTIDMIATDHAPHTAEEKAWPIDEAPFGIVGLETAFSLLYTHLVKLGICTLSFLIEKMSTIPAKTFGLNGGTLRTGALADLVVFDLETLTEIDPTAFVSKGKNTPFAKWSVYGMTYMTVVNGKIIYKEGEFYA